MTDVAITDPSAEEAVKTEMPLESTGKSLRADIRYGASLVVQYVKAEPLAGSLLIAYQFAHSGLAMSFFLKMQLAFADIVNALAARNGAVIPGIITQILLFAVVTTVLGAIGTWSRLSLRMRMRRVLTTTLLDRWLNDNRFFHLERRARIDYPEQRIQEDIFQFVDKLTQIGVAVLGSFFGVLLYTSELWRLSPPIAVPAIGVTQPIPGLLVYLAFIFAVAMTMLVHWVGALLTRAEVVRQRLEAQFRSEMHAVRANGESIAFVRAAPLERRRLADTFALIVLNWRTYTVANMRITISTALPDLLLMLMPYLLCIPFVLDGRMQIGHIQIVSAAFSQVYNGIGALVTQYAELAIWRSSIARLRLFDEALSQPVSSDIVISESAAPRIAVRDLKIAFPDGTPMVALDGLAIEAGARVLVQGTSGAGKSTLLRSIAGLWPYGGGAVELPANANIAFLPQRNYMPDGTIAGLMAYPHGPDHYPDEQYISLLIALGLERLLPHLHSFQPWSRILSPGEQQRIAAARAILSQPDFLFIDEGTSALDAQSEAKVYQTIVERLPKAALISVAHRESVAPFHQQLLRLEKGRASLSPLG
ncbi:ABC transporter ATP-binding protein/permease [Janthinobacterium aquaticum]|uniref:ABC transporter ATP-binding protein/permease n=1 Tax=Janthinobacterium sp. FT58W TaxID=2654254 RepID=UPI00126406BF|nr:SbmA/BacA-like family transporter [Janthinobacterium sp. FT58W]KAB8043388.1 ATP-binding cassette domain-containing protein [Janthinobacterium sp. FT58W]